MAGQFSTPRMPNNVPKELQDYLAALVEEIRRLDRRIKDLENAE